MPKRKKSGYDDGIDGGKRRKYDLVSLDFCSHIQ